MMCDVLRINCVDREFLGVVKHSLKARLLKSSSENSKIDAVVEISLRAFDSKGLEGSWCILTCLHMLLERVEVNLLLHISHSIFRSRAKNAYGFDILEQFRR